MFSDDGAGAEVAAMGVDGGGGDCLGGDAFFAEGSGDFGNESVLFLDLDDVAEAG